MQFCVDNKKMILGILGSRVFSLKALLEALITRTQELNQKPPTVYHLRREIASLWYSAALKVCSAVGEENARVTVASIVKDMHINTIYVQADDEWGGFDETDKSGDEAVNKLV